MGTCGFSPQQWYQRSWCVVYSKGWQTWLLLWNCSQRFSRDVHQTNRNGQKEWHLNEKPKRSAEVQFRHLNDQDKLDFLRAMQGEAGSYLENEAVAIASRHGVPSEGYWECVGCSLGKSFKMIRVKPLGVNLKLDWLSRFPRSRFCRTWERIALLWVPNLGTFCCQFLPCNFGRFKPETLRLRSWMGQNWIPTCHLCWTSWRSQRHVRHEVPWSFRILKAIYGLLHAPRCWYQKLDSVLVDQGWVKCRLEPCVWKLFQNGKLQGLVGGHVDDLLICGDLENQYFCQKIDLLRQAFPFGSWKNAQKESLTFCGCELVQKQDFSIELNQENTPTPSVKSTWLENVSSVKIVLSMTLKRNSFVLFLEVWLGVLLKLLLGCVLVLRIFKVVSKVLLLVMLLNWTNWFVLNNTIATLLCIFLLMF